MVKGWRLRLGAAVVMLTAAAASAAAQTVYVRGVPQGSTVEALLNTTSVGTTKADAQGDAAIPMNLSAAGKKTEIDALVFVDVCGTDRFRVLVVDRSAPMPAELDGCDRRDLPGLFLVRPVSSIVVNMGGATPRVLLVQGRYSLLPPGPKRFWVPPRAGFVIFGGAGLPSFSDAAAIACGTGASCSGGDSSHALAAGATYWIRPFLAAEASFLRPAKLTVTGSGSNFDFDTTLDVEVFNIVGKVGIPAGPMRFYGQFGGAYHRAVFSTRQTVDDATITVDGVDQTIPGGTQTFALETAGWGMTFGGGAEAWINRYLAAYGEINRTQIKGSPKDDGEGTMDDGLTTFMFGVRLRLGK
jgi:hypothetical protein